MTHDEFPRPPQFSSEQFAEFERSGDFGEFFFEHYKYVGTLSSFLSCIRLESPALRRVNRRDFAVLVGLLNRCARLMLANVALAHEGRFGETTSIIDRCIFESTINVRWLCNDQTSARFTRFVSSGLQPEIELRAKINSTIADREGKILKIEERMLKSIADHIRDADITDEELAKTTKMPNLAATIESLGDDRLTYIVGQRIGSHHVHGTWPSLLLHYLEKDEHGEFHPRDHDCETHVNQLATIPLMVLTAMHAFVEYVVDENTEKAELKRFIATEYDQILNVYLKLSRPDFE